MGKYCIRCGKLKPTENGLLCEHCSMEGVKLRVIKRSDFTSNMRKMSSDLKEKYERRIACAALTGELEAFTILGCDIIDGLFIIMNDGPITTVHVYGIVDEYQEFWEVD